jgi:hypothetical protein
MDTQLESLVADQLHPDDVVTVTMPLPPAAENDSAVGETLKLHDGAVGVEVFAHETAIISRAATETAQLARLLNRPRTRIVNSLVDIDDPDYLSPNLNTTAKVCRLM